MDAALAQSLDRPLGRVEPRLASLLRLGAYQILELQGLRDAAIVDESVKLVQSRGLARAAGFVNAVLRALLRRVESGALRYPDPAQDPVGYLRDWGSLPEWLADRWLQQFGLEEATSLAEACTRAPPRCVRVSPGVDADDVVRRLGGRRGDYAPDAVTSVTRDPVRDPGFAQGEFTVQDEASQLVPLLLGAEPGDTVVDCCAAPGTKAVQLAQQVGPRGDVVALELHQSRLALIHKAASRLGLSNLRVLQRDAAKGFDLQGRVRFSHILVDAPCTGLGTLRRNPDARWRLRAEEIPRAADRSLALLRSCARYVESGGVLVYSVCTFSPEETSGVVGRFLETHADFKQEDVRAHLPEAAGELVDKTGALATFPHRHGCDGFFAARLVKT
jgi:16S rRNA (cytosine967-C5)-methyltransferase